MNLLISMRKMKKINGYLVVKFNARELREYEGTALGEYGVIDAELYTGNLDVDRGAMEYDNAGSMEEAVELARKAGSLYPGGPAPVSRAALAGAIARELLALCPAFDCLDEYRARCFVPGHWVTVCAETETYAAKALAIDEEGRLVIQRENGRQEALRCGEVTTRPARTE